MNDKNNANKVATGLLIAGLAGYVAGIMTAPKSGKETRDDIKNGANRAVDAVEEKYLNLREDIDDLIEIATDKMVSTRGRAKDQLDDAIFGAKEARRKATTVAKAFKNGEADEPELNRAMKQLKDAKKNLTRYLKS